MTDETLITEKPKGAKRWTKQDGRLAVFGVGQIKEGMEIVATPADITFRYSTKEGGGDPIYDFLSVPWADVLEHAPTDAMRKILESRGEIGGDE